MLNTRATLRLLSLFLLAFGLFGLSGLALLLLAALMLLAAFVWERSLPSLWLQRVLRLKWFFLAIFILYGVSGWRLSAEAALAEAAYRVGILALLVGAVAIALHRLPPLELAEGLARLLAPLRWLGVPVEHFSHRLAATLDAVNHMETRVRAMDRSQVLDSVAAICLSAEDFHAPRSSHIHVVPGRAMDWCLLFGALGSTLGLRLV